MSISVSNHSLQIAKLNLSNFDENSVISFQIEILRNLNPLSTPFYSPNVLHVVFRVETNPANRKTQSFNFRRKRCYFVLDWDVSTYNGSFHSILHTERIACRFQCRNNPCKSQKGNLSNCDEDSVISLLIEMLRPLRALSPPFYTPNVVHVDFRVETKPANRKTQSFKFRLRLCYFVTDWDVSTFKGSFHSILQG
jgi:hypothetical protein